jgi:prolyl-tRNA synthetase
VPIYRTDDERALVMDKAARLKGMLIDQGVRVKLDDRDHLNPGAKFYEWERKGVPFRMEVGPKDVDKQQVVLVRRLAAPDPASPDAGARKRKEFLGEFEAVAMMSERLEEFQRELRERALRRREENSYRGVTDWGEMKEILETKGGFVYTGWNGDPAVEERVKDEMKATARVLPDEEFRSPAAPTKCISGEGDAKHEVMWARAY